MKARDYITVDERGRTNLNRVRALEHQHIRTYLAEEDSTGTITLTPAAVVPARLIRPVPELPEEAAIGA